MHDKAKKRYSPPPQVVEQQATTAPTPTPTTPNSNGLLPPPPRRELKKSASASSADHTIPRTPLVQVVDIPTTPVALRKPTRRASDEIPIKREMTPSKSCLKEPENTQTRISSPARLRGVNFPDQANGPATETHQLSFVLRWGQNLLDSPKITKITTQSVWCSVSIQGGQREFTEVAFPDSSHTWNWNKKFTFKLASLDDILSIKVYNHPEREFIGLIHQLSFPVCNFVSKKATTQTMTLSNSAVLVFSARCRKRHGDGKNKSKSPILTASPSSLPTAPKLEDGKKKRRSTSPPRKGSLKKSPSLSASPSPSLQPQPQDSAPSKLVLEPTGVVGTLKLLAKRTRSLTLPRMRSSSNSITIESPSAKPRIAMAILAQ